MMPFDISVQDIPPSVHARILVPLTEVVPDWPKKAYLTQGDMLASSSIL